MKVAARAMAERKTFGQRPYRIDMRLSLSDLPDVADVSAYGTVCLGPAKTVPLSVDQRSYAEWIGNDILMRMP